MNTRPPVLLLSYYFGLVALLYLPIAVLFLFSINRNTTLSVPLQGFTFDWYSKLFASQPVLRFIAQAMVSAWLLAFTVSFDEFALALFLAGTEPTFPVYLFSQLRFANRLPIMIALAVLMMIGSLTLVLVADRLRRAD